MKNRIISLFVYLLPGLIYAQNNADDKYEILSLTDMFSLFKDSKNSVPKERILLCSSMENPKQKL